MQKTQNVGNAQDCIKSQNPKISQMSLKDVLLSKGAEYAPFDVMRVHRIYKHIAPLLGFETIFNKKCKVIHIMGTNGKGSTGRFLTMGLAQHKKRVLHFSSPHIFNFNERFFVCREDYCGDIDENELELAHKILWGIESVREASYFEYATFLALLLARDCEYLVLEAGVGDEYDSTSVISADISVFTLIGLDHKDMLGESLGEIALTKLKAMSGRVILARQNHKEVENLALNLATQKGLECELWQDIHADKRLRDEAQDFTEYCQRYTLPSFLRENLHNAMRVMWHYGMNFDFNSLPILCLRGRCERFKSNIVLDVGHNLDGAKVLCEYLSGKQVILVYNSYADKDIEAILRELLPIIKKVLILYAERTRICPREKLVHILQTLGVEYEDFELRKINDEEQYLVFGSFSVVELFLQQYKGM